MTTHLIRILLASLLLLHPVTSPAAKTSSLKTLTPRPAPELALPLAGGGRVELARLRGQVVLVNFWATWCPPCRKEMPSMERLAQRMKGRPFTLLAVNVGETEAQVQAYLNQIGVTFPVPMDPEGQRVKEWQAFVFPTSYLVDKSGRLRHALQGSIEWDEPEAVQVVEALLAE